MQIGYSLGHKYFPGKGLAGKSSVIKPLWSWSKTSGDVRRCVPITHQIWIQYTYSTAMLCTRLPWEFIFHFQTVRLTDRQQTQHMVLLINTVVCRNTVVSSSSLQYCSSNTAGRIRRGNASSMLVWDCEKPPKIVQMLLVDCRLQYCTVYHTTCPGASIFGDAATVLLYSEKV